MRDAIALHLELETAEGARPEVAAVRLGSAADAIGARLDHLPPACSPTCWTSTRDRL
ncbi:hypothetical protein R6L23_07415 [Streptomyces sp. SR27]|uniref:hypothetical protein n=1 Tax=Streptomyces sp. SR27 TaxID=3076630 RepID=UPI00295BEC32|nr:hypothetical protein [Streptomyces sp. SR27]MDV9188046.1 hypothetical protein [Streptomyces sp. SR27]